MTEAPIGDPPVEQPKKEEPRPLIGDPPKKEEKWEAREYTR